MTDEPPSPQVVALAPRPRDFTERVREIASDSANIRWSRHALDRMRERGITIRQGLCVLREGHVIGPISPGGHPGELKAKFVRNIKGRRDVGVVVLLIRNSRLTVKTVEWEDIR